jgi:hypothetical protein
VKLQVWLKYGNDDILVPCFVHDISATGARLAVSGNADLPPEFIIYLSETGTAQRRCQVVWRSATHVGVTFTA